MLTLRIIHLLTVGFCLLLIAKYMQWMVASARSLDRLMLKRFFNVEGLTDDIREISTKNENGTGTEHRSDQAPVLNNRIYRWLCVRLRRAVGLDAIKAETVD